MYILQWKSSLYTMAFTLYCKCFHDGSSLFPITLQWNLVPPAWSGPRPAQHPLLLLPCCSLSCESPPISWAAPSSVLCCEQCCSLVVSQKKQCVHACVFMAASRRPRPGQGRATGSRPNAEPPDSIAPALAWGLGCPPQRQYSWRPDRCPRCCNAGSIAAGRGQMLWLAVLALLDPRPM